MFAAFLTTILFCLSAIAATRTARVLGGTEANFWRIALAAVLLGGYAYSFGGGAGGVAFPIFLLSGLIGFGIGDLALFQALPRLGSRLTSLLVHCLAAPFAAASEWLWLGTRLTAQEMLCGAVILAGVALALAPAEHLHLERKVFWPGVLFGVFAALGQGLGAVLSRHAYAVAQAAGENVDGLTAAFQRSIAGVVLAGLFLLVVKREHLGPAVNGGASLGVVERWRGKWSVWGWIALNALTGPTLGVGCFQWALKTTPSGVVLPIVATVPVVIIPFSVWIEGERITARSVVGGVVAVAGAVALAVLRNAS